MACKSASLYVQTVQTWYSKKMHSARMTTRDPVREKAVMTDMVVVLQTVFTLCSSNPFVTRAVFHDMMLIVTSLKVKMSSGDVHPALSAARHSD